MNIKNIIIDCPCCGQKLQLQLKDGEIIVNYQEVETSEILEKLNIEFG